MISLKDAVKSLLSTTETKQDESCLNCAIALDVSGSTSSKFLEEPNGTTTILEKELIVIKEFMRAHPNYKYSLHAFSYETKKYPISIFKEEDIVTIPSAKELQTDGITYTNTALISINAELERPDLVLIVTDGLTDSSQADLQQEVSKLVEKKARIEVIAVSTSNTDMNQIKQSEEAKIPGMDLINRLNNSIDSLIIYNKVHKDNPYVGAINSRVNKKNLMFMGFPVVGSIPEFLDNLLTKLFTEEKKDAYDLGRNQAYLKELLVEIGKLFSVIFVVFPESHFGVNKIISHILANCSVGDLTIERMFNILKYGFSCTKNNRPIVYTNFDQHVKDQAVKHAEFADAVNMLNTKGTGLESTKTISIPSNGVCVINNNNRLSLTKSLGTYPRSCDSHGNAYFDCTGLNDQAIRIGMREFCGKIGFPNARNSPNVIFYILNQMSLLLIKGVDLQSEHMKELQKLAIAQTSMENMVARQKYSGVGFYTQWKTGKAVAMSYTSPNEYHSSLYKDTRINPLGLSEPLWWALMMTTLGLFKEQLSFYEAALSYIGVSNQEEFIAYLQKEHSSRVSGDVKFVTLDSPPTSIFTLDEFLPTDKVYLLKTHGNGCSTKTCYSKHEIDTFVMRQGCVWCHHIPQDEEKEFEEVHIDQNPEKLVLEAMQQSFPLQVIGTKNKCSNNSSSDDYDNNSSQNLSSSSLSTTIEEKFAEMKIGNSSKEQKFLIQMIGVTGAGKSTSSELIQKLVMERNGLCLILSSDKHSKKGCTGKGQALAIQKEFRQFEMTPSPLKVVVVDICNEKGPSSQCFGCNFSGYKSLCFYPNLPDFERFDEYECWCLNNVLSRPMHSNKTNYWLNPVSAGVQTCIKVHNMKASSLKSFLRLSKPALMFSEKLEMEQIKQLIAERAAKYTEVTISTESLQNHVKEFIDKMLN